MSNNLHVVEKEDPFPHWSTEPETVKIRYKPFNYTGEEWKQRNKFERLGNDMYRLSAYVTDLDELEV